MGKGLWEVGDFDRRISYVLCNTNLIFLFKHNIKSWLIVFLDSKGAGVYTNNLFIPVSRTTIGSNKWEHMDQEFGPNCLYDLKILTSLPVFLRKLKIFLFLDWSENENYNHIFLPLIHSPFPYFIIQTKFKKLIFSHLRFFSLILWFAPLD